MRYHSVSSGGDKDYLVHPYRLAFAQGGLYLLAYVPGYKDIRTFAVDRIASVSLEKQTFTPKQNVGDEVFANSLGVNTGPAAQVEIEFEPRVAPYVRARVWHASQQLREGADGDARPFDERVSRLGPAQLDPELGSVRARARRRLRWPGSCERTCRRPLRRYGAGLNDEATGSDSRLCRAGVPVLRRPVTAPLLHRLAVVRRGRLPAGVPHHAAGAGRRCSPSRSRSRRCG